MPNEYKCDYCGKIIKPNIKRLVCYTQGNLICSVSCLTNFYDINWIRVATIATLFDSKENDKGEQ